MFSTHVFSLVDARREFDIALQSFSLNVHNNVFEVDNKSQKMVRVSD